VETYIVVEAETKVFRTTRKGEPRTKREIQSRTSGRTRKIARPLGRDVKVKFEEKGRARTAAKQKGPVLYSGARGRKREESSGERGIFIQIRKGFKTEINMGTQIVKKE